MDKEALKLKDTQKVYLLGDSFIRVFNRQGRQILDSEVKSISHFGVVRDYKISLHDGGEIWLPSEFVKMIVEHENGENNGQAKRDAFNSGYEKGKQELVEEMISTAIVGLDALPKEAASFWRGYWQGIREYGQAKLKEWQIDGERVRKVKS